MNTLSDTDEGKVSPSVWPVYVAAVVIVGCGAVWVYVCFLWVLDFPSVPPEKTWIHVFLVVYMGLCGAFSLVAAVGTSLLRPWAWRLATVWGYLIGLSGLAFLLHVAHETLITPDKSFLEPDEVLDKIIVPLALGVFVVWAIATRRQLFFPPKPEGEE